MQSIQLANLDVDGLQHQAQEHVRRRTVASTQRRFCKEVSMLSMRMRVLRMRIFGKAELAIKRRFPRIGPKFIEFAWPLLMRIFWRGSYTSYKS
jgi:hypothetical protein